MPDLIYYVASSLDGYIATSDGGVEWLKPFEESGEEYGWAEFYASIDGIVMGSGTYQFALDLGKWNAPDTPSWVFTSRELPVMHESITLTKEEPAELLKKLEAQGHKRLWFMGGGKLASSFRSRGLITHYIIALIPVVLGEGIPLFAPHSGQDSLKLTETKKYASGVIQLSYESEPGRLAKDDRR